MRDLKWEHYVSVMNAYWDALIEVRAIMIEWERHGNV